MERKQFTFYASFAAAMRRVRSDAARCKGYEAIIDYALYGKTPELDKLPEAVAAAMEAIMPVLDSAAKKAAAGRKGGRSNPDSACASEEANDKQTQATAKQNEAKRSNAQANAKQEQDKDKEQDKEKEEEEDKDKDKGREQEQMLYAISSPARTRVLPSAVGVDNPFGRTEMSDYYDEQARQIKRIVEGLQSSFDFAKLDALIPPGWVRDEKGNVVKEGSAE